MDIRARSFGIKGQRALFDVRIFDPSALRYQPRVIEQCLASNVRGKKRELNRRILDTEHGSFTPTYAHDKKCDGN